MHVLRRSGRPPCSSVGHLVIAALSLIPLLGLSGAVGCAHGPPTGGPPDRCSEINEQNQRTLAALAGGSGSDLHQAFNRSIQAAAWCRLTPKGGTWALILEELKASAAGIRGRWALVHRNADGPLVSAYPGTALSLGGASAETSPTGDNLEWTPEVRVVPQPPVLFDYDADGEPEAVVIVRTEMVNEGGQAFQLMQGHVWRAAPTALELYGPARDCVVEEVRDVDGDGRPDLVSRGPYTGLASVKCGSDDPYPVLGPRLLAQARAGGGFSWSDATSIHFARQQCVTPGAGGALLVAERERPGIVDLPASARNIACARLWGAAPAPMDAEIDMRCGRADACPACDDAELLRQWARARPPLRLSELHSVP